ncbi:Histidine kinase-, DNA gyrase B-, and HSP90-like ATPase [Thermoactinomyces sp. DSM 45891]|uniref:ATP-binding protein n=1 Tax=Thermoactinomyces sp. DSM 45891 TaxID=1761907 RepID=UPI000920E98A|nr:ATP-binding protein [Thermoactinomyces sp. DSM 45891]SFX31934.1 Histidine kinase-, DNA gyrase B-, and HSP90-like ATPase [Thermoactinomyces sp. DSM 45891]
MVNTDRQTLVSTNSPRAYQLRTLLPNYNMERPEQILLSKMGIGYLYLDEYLIFREMNRYAERFLGVTAKTLLDRQWFVICNLRPMDRNNLRALYDFFEDLQVEKQMEIKWTVKGCDRYLLFKSVPLECESKNDFYVTIEDITVPKMLEENIKHMDRLSHLGLIASNTAHDLKNAFTCFKGFLQMERENESGSKPEQWHQYLEFIQNSLEKFSSFAKVEQQNSLEIIHPQKSLQDTVRFLQGHASNKGIHLYFEDRNREIPPVVANELELRHVIMNLCINAMEASKEGGGVVVELDYDPEKGNVSIHVKDEGCGIPKVNLSRIFDLYYTTKKNGTGVGLYNCKKLIDSFHGTISVESSATGTIFTVALPAKKAHFF